MNLCDLVSYLTEQEEEIEEVLLEDESGQLWDFELEIQDEIFDGWDTAYPAVIKIKKRDA